MQPIDHHFTASEFQTGAVPHILEVCKLALFASQFCISLICSLFTGSKLECVFARKQQEQEEICAERTKI